MRRLRGILFLFLVLVVAAVVIVLGILPRLRARQVLASQTDYLAAPAVTVIHPRTAAPAEEVVLPGSIQAFVDAPIYARTAGYIKKWNYDIGAHVRQGALLAQIESPEVDQQLQQSRDEVRTSQANLKLAQITEQRYSDLFKSDSVARQDVDNAVQDAAAKAATVKAAQANVARLEQMVAFEQVTAPFEGVVTARNTDIGQLIESGSVGGPTRELFHMATVNKLRVFINVPQQYSHEAIPGVHADLTLPELPGKRFPGLITRTAGAFDPSTRTLPVEVDVMNSTGLLFPGAYTEVHLKVSARTPALLVPPTSLLFRADGLRAATVVNGHASLLPVTLGRDFGNEVEVVAGLTPQTTLIVSPPDSLVNGEAVRVMQHHPSEAAE